MDSLPLIGLLVVLVALSSFFSATETSFSALNKTRLKNLAQNGKRGADKALHLSDSYDDLLSTILIGNNIVNIAAASVATILFTKILGDNGALVSTVVMTIAVLIFGEITPKSMAKERPEKFACAVAGVIGGLMTVLTPMNFIFRKWKELVSRLFKPEEEENFIEEELMTMVDEAQSEGDMDVHEGELIRSAIEFNDVDVGEIITPRVDIDGLSTTATTDDAAQMFIDTGFSRLPIYRDSMDDIVGILHEKDFYKGLREKETSLVKMMKTPVYAPTTMKITTLLQLLKNSKNHMAVVVDEFGGTEGIVTMEDVLEELVGEIYDEHDDVEEDVKTLNDGSLLVNGSYSLSDLMDTLHMDKEYDSDTVGGWVIEEMGVIPKTGESFDVPPLHVVITRVSKRRVLQVRVYLPKADDSVPDSEEIDERRK